MMKRKKWTMENTSKLKALHSTKLLLKVILLFPSQQHSQQHTFYSKNFASEGSQQAQHVISMKSK